MTAFELDVTDKEIDGADGIDVVNRRVIGALIRRMREKTMTKAQLADKLGIQRSQISKLLRGNQNLTARTIGEILGALDFDFDLALLDRKTGNGVEDTPQIAVHTVITSRATKTGGQVRLPQVQQPVQRSSQSISKGTYVTARSTTPAQAPDRIATQ